jgi:hypothetical protein
LNSDPSAIQPIASHYTDCAILASILHEKTAQILSGTLTSGTNPHNKNEQHYFPAVLVQAEELSRE